MEKAINIPATSWILRIDLKKDPLTLILAQKLMRITSVKVCTFKVKNFPCFWASTSCWKACFALKNLNMNQEITSTVI